MDKVLNEFQVILVKISPSLENYQRNVKTLKIETSDFKGARINNAASYNERENKIYLRDLFASESLYHELFHVASTKVEDNNVYSGISLNNYNVGLNEGITQFLTEKYFKKNEEIITYPYETIIAHLLYKIMDKELITSYFKADIKSFFINLSKYLKIEEIEDLINSLDFIHHNNYQNEREVKQKIEVISLILAKAYKAKGLLLTDFISDLDCTFKINEVEYDFLPNIEEVKNEYRKSNCR